jgi:hypothetical protein
MHKRPLHAQQSRYDPVCLHGLELLGSLVASEGNYRHYAGTLSLSMIYLDDLSVLFMGEPRSQTRLGIVCGLGRGLELPESSYLVS